MAYVITRGGNRKWPSREYELREIKERAKHDERKLVDGYGRGNFVNPSKVRAVPIKKDGRMPVEFKLKQEDIPATAFGAR